MTRRKLIYLAIQSAVCVALTALLCASAIAVYREGSARSAADPLESVYTPEIVAEKLAPIAPLFVVGASLLVVGLALGIRDERADRPARAAKAPGTAGGAARDKRTGRLRAIIAAAAAALILAGILNGSALDVLYKAISICSECVGLG